MLQEREGGLATTEALGGKGGVAGVRKREAVG
jgi:hypothetical protein